MILAHILLLSIVAFIDAKPFGHERVPGESVSTAVLASHDNAGIQSTDIPKVHEVLSLVSDPENKTQEIVVGIVALDNKSDDDDDDDYDDYEDDDIDDEDQDFNRFLVLLNLNDYFQDYSSRISSAIDDILWLRGLKGDLVQLKFQMKRSQPSEIDQDQLDKHNEKLNNLEKAIISIKKRISRIKKKSVKKH